MAGGLDSIDRALKTHKAGSRRLSLLAVYFSPDHRRRRAADRLPARADSARVLRTLGPRPTRCPPGTMDHVEGGLAMESSAEADSAMARLRRDTRQRWIYPGRSGCTPRKGETELGIDSAGRVLWIQPGAQKGDVKLSPAITY